MISFVEHILQVTGCKTKVKFWHVVPQLRAKAKKVHLDKKINFGRKQERHPLLKTPLQPEKKEENVA